MIEFHFEKPGKKDIPSLIALAGWAICAYMCALLQSNPDIGWQALLDDQWYWYMGLLSFLILYGTAEENIR